MPFLAAHVQKPVALFKGVLILMTGLFVLCQMAYRIAVPVIPTYETMGLVSLLALLANGTCLVLLWKHREEDINTSSAENARAMTLLPILRYLWRQVAFFSLTLDGRTFWLGWHLRCCS